MAFKIYKLTICYNDNTDEVEWLKEEVESDDESLQIGDYDLSDYFDKEIVAILNNSEIGET